MPKWSDLMGKVFPWLGDPDKSGTRRIRDEAAAVTAEQEALAPWIEAQSNYLVTKGEMNGFTRQLQIGFQRRTTGE